MRLTLVALLLLHPLHTTHTDLIEDSGEVTVQVRAFSDDLRNAVSGQEGAADDSAVARYLRGRITLTDSAGRVAPLAYTGKSVEGDITILRLRAVTLHHLARTSVSQLMHTELFSDQVNVVQARYQGQRVSFLFVPGDRPKRIP